jgi:hypothetical protein
LFSRAVDVEALSMPLEKSSAGALYVLLAAAVAER